MLDDSYSKIVDSLKKEELAIFVGSAISYSPPSLGFKWDYFNSTIIELLLKKIRPAWKFNFLINKKLNLYKIILNDSNKKYKIRPEVFLQILYDLIQEYYSKNYFDDLFTLFSVDLPNKNHYAIAKMAKLRKLSVIITTNFDQGIEEAFIQEGMREGQDKDFEIILEPDTNLAQKIIDKLKKSRNDHIFIFKIHGTIEKENQHVYTKGIVATLTQAGRKLSAPWCAILDYVINNYHTLFVGYSGEDDDIYPKLLAASINKNIKMITWIIRPNDPNKRIEELISECGPLGNLLAKDIDDKKDNFLPKLCNIFMPNIQNIDNMINFQIVELLKEEEERIKKKRNEKICDWIEGVDIKHALSIIGRLLQESYIPESYINFDKDIIAKIDFLERFRLLDYAWECYYKSYELCLKSRTKNPFKFNNLGQICLLKHNFEYAVHWFKKELEICQALNDVSCMAKLYINLGIAYGFIKNLTSSERIELQQEMFTKAFNCAKSNNDVNHEITALNNLGNILKKIGRFQEAKAKFKESKERAEEIGFLLAVGFSTYQLAGVYYLERNYLETKILLKESLYYLERCGDIVGKKKVESILEMIESKIN